MPILGNALDFAKYEALNIRVHNTNPGPSSPVAGQLYYNNSDNTLYFYDGSGWISTRGAGSPPDATTTTKGLIQLTGDLTGTATAPAIATGAVTSAKIADGTITDTDVAAANKDGATGVASLRTLGFGAQQAIPGNAKLNQLGQPSADIPMNGFTLQNLPFPTNGNDAASKTYVDNAAQGLDAKASVRAATTANIATLAGGAPNSLDGVSLAANDRILVKDQTTPAQNGIYYVFTLGTGSNGNWQRAVDQDAWTEVPSAYVWVEEGTVNKDTGWVSTADKGGTLDTTAMPWVQFAAAGTAIAGAGLTKTGNTFDVGAGAGITVNADSIQVANDGITNAMIADGAINLATADVTGTLPVTKGGTGGTSTATARAALGTPGYYSNSATHGAGTTISITAATHGLGAKRAILVQVQDNTTGQVEFPDVVVAATGDVTITYGTALSANTKLVTLVG